MITPPQGFWLSEDGDRDEIEAMRDFGRYLVGMCFLVRRKRIDNPEKQIQPVFRSGFVMELDGQWYWMTAGHVLEEIATSEKDSDLVLENFRLLDHYGSGAIDKNYVPFNFEHAWKYFEHNDSLGLDYGAVKLGKLEQLGLAKNNVRALPMAEWRQLQGKVWDEHFMYGLPTDSLKIRMTPNPTAVTVHANAHPTLIHVEKLVEPPSAPTQYPRFFGKLGDNWPAGSIVGMSGGPVFGFNTETGEYGVVAVQSGWLEQRRITFACPIAEFCPRLIAAIQARSTC